jgi:very-short-patch-repair endonuclease
VKIDLNNSWQEEIEKLSEPVKFMFNKQINWFAAHHLRVIDKCQSPIEEMVGVYLSYFEIKFRKLFNRFKLEPQAIIDCSGTEYRVDFYISLKYKNIERRIIIECDGHEFHEKSKEQVINDNKRDRHLIYHGYEVLRFSGSEIYNHINESTKEILDYLLRDAIEDGRIIPS